ncbi:unnamed protein product [Linum tenue]|uniref:C2H2-type domain-containing protein n=1 Tax=Linum tenue TaxID=586396 RepID=A0AAV0N3W6_9ROSI|nr:unnamed protein product [Linum tenue]
METGSRADHGTNVTPAAAPGHESHGVHVCQKCGWPFPNPHPNARHRRAHRKICGTLPGYSLLPQLQTAHSPVSDDDQHSDGDLKTPSPKVLERSHFEMSSGGPGGRSNKSEDDVFSDAVADFPDTGSISGFQQRLEEGFKGTITHKDTANVEFPEDAVSGGGTSDETTQMQILEVQPDRVAPVSEDNNPIATTDLTEKEPGNESANAGGVLMGDLNPMITGNHMNDFGEASKSNANDLNGTFQKGNDQTTAEVHVIDGLVSSGDATALDLFEGMPGTEKAVAVNSSTEPNFDTSQLDGAHAANSDEVPQFKEEFCEKIETRSSLDDVKSTDQTDASVGIVEAKVDVPVGPASASSSESVEGLNCMDYENAHILSVHGDIKYAGNAEAMIKGFKGEGSKSLQTVNLGSDGITNDIKDSGSSVDYDFSSSPTKQLVGETLSTASEVQALGYSPELKGEGYLGSTAEVLSDANQQVPSANREAEQLKRPAADTQSGNYRVPNNEASDLGDNSEIAIMELHKEDDKADSEPDNIVFENARLHGQLDVPDVTGAKSSAQSSLVDQNDNQAASEPDNIIFENERLHGQLDTPDVSGPENSAPSSLVDQNDNQAASEPDNIIFEDERLHGQLDTPDVTGAENSAPSSLVDHNVSMKIKETLESDIEQAQIGVSKQGIQETKSIESISFEGVNAIDCQGEIIERDVSPVAGSVSGSAMENSSVVSKVMLESTDVHESSTMAEKSVNAKDRQLKEESACLNMVEVSNTEASLEKPETESTPGVGGTPELDKSEDAFLPKSAQDPVTNDCITSSNSDSLKATVARDDHTTNLVGEASQDKPEPFGKGGDSVTKQLGTSAADISVDSNSQTDSLEGHWGSVSVLSTQSDMPVSTAKTNAPQDSDKSDMFEAPSFMTLVEPRTAGDQKAAGGSSEIHSAQNQQQSKAQAGWFPSITNVVNESQGRKKNEEIIAKVTNWSNTGKQHTPLKSLLGEANQETKSRSSPTHAKENAAGSDKGRDSGVRSPTTQAKEAAGRKEWNSPARYPAEIKREKRKEKGRPYWAHLVCCASVN